MFLNSLINITKIVLISSLFLFSSSDSFCQKYSVDHGKIKKSGRVGLRYKLHNARQNKKDRRELVAHRKENRKSEKARKEHLTKLQTRKTKQQMKSLYRTSVRNNKHKPTKYWHERFYKQITTSTKISFVKSKIFIKNSVDNIKDFVSISNKKDISKKERFF